eukprot:comp20600_c0_seq1/m.41918 comp20600_c0_seq1/g.41918  ORF comp20600_c0_seq1/g.41918 comp20600_c0_seq1/m.41918 type:complete len:445 (-) comp20600_c0_seq1:355-1689(-)
MHIGRMFVQDLVGAGNKIEHAVCAVVVGCDFQGSHALHHCEWICAFLDEQFDEIERPGFGGAVQRCEPNIGAGIDGGVPEQEQLHRKHLAGSSSDVQWSHSFIVLCIHGRSAGKQRLHGIHIPALGGHMQCRASVAVGIRESRAGLEQHPNCGRIVVCGCGVDCGEPGVVCTPHQCLVFAQQLFHMVLEMRADRRMERGALCVVLADDCRGLFRLVQGRNAHCGASVPVHNSALRALAQQKQGHVRPLEARSNLQCGASFDAVGMVDQSAPAFAHQQLYQKEISFCCRIVQRCGARDIVCIRACSGSEKQVGHGKVAAHRAYMQCGLVVPCGRRFVDADVLELELWDQGLHGWNVVFAHTLVELAQKCFAGMRCTECARGLACIGRLCMLSQQQHFFHHLLLRQLGNREGLLGLLALALVLAQSVFVAPEKMLVVHASVVFADI